MPKNIPTLILLLTFLCRKGYKDAKNVAKTQHRIYIDTYSVGIFCIFIDNGNLVHAVNVCEVHPKCLGVRLGSPKSSHLNQSWSIMAIKCLFPLTGYKGSAELERRHLSFSCSKLNGINPCNALERPMAQNIYLPFHFVSHLLSQVWFLHTASCKLVSGMRRKRASLRYRLCNWLVSQIPYATSGKFIPNPCLWLLRITESFEKTLKIIEPNC